MRRRRGQRHQGDGHKNGNTLFHRCSPVFSNCVSDELPLAPVGHISDPLEKLLRQPAPALTGGEQTPAPEPQPHSGNAKLKKPFQAARTAVATLTTAPFFLASETLPQSNGIDPFRSSVRTPDEPEGSIPAVLPGETIFATVFPKVSWGICQPQPTARVISVGEDAPLAS